MHNEQLEKRLAIINATLQTALSITDVLKSTKGVLKRKPRFVNRHLYGFKARKDRKQRIACAIAQLATNSAIGSAQVAIIASAPMPKFKSGSPATIHDNGKEEIIYPANNKTGEQQ